jgi:hypothetical protein
MTMSVLNITRNNTRSLGLRVTPSNTQPLNFVLAKKYICFIHLRGTSRRQSETGIGLALGLDEKLSATMRNPPGRNLLRLTSRAVSTSSGLGSGGASTSAASPRPRTVAGGRPLRATSPPPRSAVAAATYWESRALRRDGEDWEEVVAGAAPGPGEMDEEEEYRVVFWSPPTIDEVTGAITSIQE